jgi:hypothetical protein
MALLPPQQLMMMMMMQILKTELNLKNKITVINTLATSVLVYSFRIINWLKKLGRWIKKKASNEGIYHLKADVNIFYISRQNGGHGLVELEYAYNAAIVGLSADIKQGNDRLTILVQEYNAKKIKNSLQKEAKPVKQNMTEETAVQSIKKSTSVQH